MALFTRATANKSLFILNFHSHLPSTHSRIQHFTSLLKGPRIFGRCHQVNRENVPLDKNPTSKSFTWSKGAAPTDSVFERFLWERRRESERSILVQVQSANSYKDLYSYCTEFGAVRGMYHYVVGKNTHFFIVEFRDQEAHKALLSSATHINHQDVIPAHSHMLWFRSSPKKSKKSAASAPPVTFSSGSLPTSETMMEKLSSESSVSKQMETLYDMWKLDDVCARLRFITTLQIESSLSSLFSNVTVLPFGSSVNGFGKRGCDLDLVLTLDSEPTENVNSRLIFQTKSCLSDERAQTKKSMEVLANVLQTFVPGVTNVRRILHAKVPIIKYDHALTGLECDLSMTNLSAVYMSELLYIFGEIDSRVRPLVFTVRQWASSVGITHHNPGAWMTNFSLTLLVLFFLQQNKVLPSINTLKNQARSSDVRLTDTCVDCTFLRDPKIFSDSHSSPDGTLESLLSDFYHFYADFDFATRAVSIREGANLYKPDASPLFICNPLEKTLNVSKNVNTQELMRFIAAARTAAVIMEEGVEAKDSRGILDIFAEKQPKQKPFVLGRNGKKIKIAELFQTKSADDPKSDEQTERRKERARRR